MTFTEIMKDIFSRKPKDAVDNSSSGGVKRFLSKISGAFMLPISVMAIAGLFLGVGAAIGSHTSAHTFGNFIKFLGDPVFGAMPLLFMIAIVISFTDDQATAVFAGVVAFLVFNAIQGPFIEAKGETLKDGSISSDTGTARFLSIHTSDVIASKVFKVSGSNLGIQSMNTSVFGGIVVGFVVSYLYNKFYQIELPSVISFFGGKRFVPLVSIVAMIPLSFIFLLIWPWVGLGFAYFGIYSGKILGFDSFIFGIIERSLIPFGLHHVFYAPLWWTGAGGDIQSTFNDWKTTHSIMSINNGAFSVDKTNIDTIKSTVEALLKIKDGSTPVFANVGAISPILATHMNGNSIDYSTITHSEISSIFSEIKLNVWTQIELLKNKSDLFNKMYPFYSISEVKDLNSVFINTITKGTYLGDSFGWLAINGSGFNKITYANNGSIDTHTKPVFEFVAKELGIRYGRFMQGKFAFMQLGLPAAGLAMIMAAPKENRRTAAAVIIPASVTSFVTGVTEPIEFTFVFLAPALFWGFHAVMAGGSFLAMNLLGAHVGMTFSGGFIDMIIYGAIPFAQGTNFYWMYVIGAVYAPIYYFVFYFVIKKWNLDTPGRGGNTKLFTKKDFLAAKSASKSGSAKGLNEQGKAIVAAFGGWDNVTKLSNCATRLRYDVKDIDKVNDAALKAAGAMGVSRIGKTHVQAIFGPVAEQINTNIKANQGASLEMSSTPGKTSETKVTTPVKKTTSKAAPLSIKGVVKGKVKDIESVEDEVFSKKLMGDGVVIANAKTAKKADYLAPIDGELVTVFPTGHAYGIRTKEGVEVLIHIGLDTVNLKGEGFTPHVKQGQTVKAGDKLVTVDLDFVRKNAPSADTIIIVTSGQTIKNKAEGDVTPESEIFKVSL